MNIPYKQYFTRLQEQGKCGEEDYREWSMSMGREKHKRNVNRAKYKQKVKLSWSFLKNIYCGNPLVLCGFESICVGKRGCVQIAGN